MIGLAGGLAAIALLAKLHNESNCPGDDDGTDTGDDPGRLPGHADQLPQGGEFPYKPPKNAQGGYTKLPGSQGIVDKKGNIWQWAPTGAQHAGPHWDVQLKGGGRKNVYPDRSVR